MKRASIYNLKPKTVLIIIGLLVAFGMIGKYFEDKNKTTKTMDIPKCDLKLDKFGVRGEHPYMINWYIKVDNYNPKDDVCKKYLKDYFINFKKTYPTPYTLHFLDGIYFDPPHDGKMYGSADIQNKVIAQMAIGSKGYDLIEFDPFGTGKY
jgi:hypothetical protein